MQILAALRERFESRRIFFVLSLLILILIFIVLISADKGSVEISQQQIFAILLKKLGVNFSSDFTVQQEATLFDIRLPRIVLGALVGAALGISGVAMQGIFRNPLADPSLIGVSSGAALAATIIVVGGDLISVSLPAVVQLFAFPIAAFLGAFLTTLLIYRLATFAGQTIVATLLLAGIAINALAQSFSGFLTFYATDTQIRSLTFWKLGSLGNGNWSSVLVALPFILIPILMMTKLARPLNALLLGEAEAGHLGFEIEKIKRRVVILAALAVGASVAFTGLITFVGLIVPHLLRLIVGPDHRYLFPASAVLGASLLLAADLIARTLVAPAEMPIGILTAMLGAPFFLYLLIRSGRRSLIN